MDPDNLLLRRYAEEGDEAAFAELVHRYMDMVYSIARRLTSGNASLAQEVSQAVFIDLARKSRTLTNRSTLSGWLHTSTRYAAHKALRGEQRRRRHEQEASIMQASDSTITTDADWERLQPLLDEAVADLREKDRDIVTLRFFQSKSHREIGDALDLGEEAARKRVDRAIEKLRAYFARRGVVVGTTPLAVVLAANSVQAAPAGLAASFSAQALAVNAAALAAPSILSQTLLYTMKTKTVVLIAAVAIIAAIPIVVQHRRIIQLQDELATGSGKTALADRKTALTDHNGATRFGADYKAALANILKIPDGNTRLRELIDLASGLDATAVSSLLDELTKNPLGVDRNIEESILFERLLQLDPKSALAWPQSLTNPTQRNQALETLFSTWANMDPAAALNATGQISDPAFRKLLQNNVLTNLANYDPQKALGLLQSLPAMNQSRNLRDIYNSVFTIWAGNDSQAAAAAAKNLPATRMRNFAIQSVANGWAEADPQGALAWAATLPAGALRDGAQNAALANLSLQNPQAAIQDLGNVTNVQQKNSDMAAIAQSWGQSDPSAALAWADQNISGQAHDTAVQSILGQLALTDSSAAQAYIGQMANGPLRDQAISQVAANEAEGNPQATLNWLQNVSGSSTPSSTIMAQMVNIVNDWASVDPQATASYAESMQGQPAFNRLIGQVGMNWASADPQGALAWAESLSADGGYSNAIQGVTAAIAIENPQLAWNDVTQLPAGDAQTQAMAVVAIKWSAQDPAQAAQALASIPTGSSLDYATTNVVKSWLTMDPTAASEWVNTLPAGNARDAAVTQIIGVEGANSPATAFNWALTIGNSATQQVELNSLMQTWAKQDPAAATTAVKSSNLNAQEQTLLLNTIQKQPAK